MPFVFESPPDTFAPITGQQIKIPGNGEPDVIWPIQILEVWSTEELANNRIHFVESFVPPSGKIITGSPSYSRVNGVITEHYEVVDAPPPLVPDQITRRQLILALLATNFITAQEAIAAATSGAVPAFIAVYFNAMPEPEKTEAIVTWASMSVCLRSDPLFNIMSANTGLTSSQIDDYFRYAFTL